MQLSLVCPFGAEGVSLRVGVYLFNEKGTWSREGTNLKYYPSLSFEIVDWKWFKNLPRWFQKPSVLCLIWQHIKVCNFQISFSHKSYLWYVGICRNQWDGIHSIWDEFNRKLSSISHWVSLIIPSNIGRL